MSPLNFRAFDEFVKTLDELASFDDDLNAVLEHMQAGRLPPLERLTKLLAEIEEAQVLRKLEECWTYWKLYRKDSEEQWNTMRREVVAAHVDQMMAGYQRVANAATYRAVLIEEICCQSTNRFRVESACREVRRKWKTLPSYAAVLELLKEQDVAWWKREAVLETVGEWTKAFKVLRSDLLEDRRRGTHTPEMATRVCHYEFKTPLNHWKLGQVEVLTDWGSVLAVYPPRMSTIFTAFSRS